MAGKTLYDKLWDSHEVKRRDDGSSLIYIDRHIIHEVTSPQAFEGLRLAGRKPWRVDSIIATPDHNVPTTPDRKGGIEAITDQVSRLQVQTLDDYCDEYGITEFKMNDVRQGIVHVIGPEQGATLPGMTVVCGDSHTSTHGAFGALTRSSPPLTTTCRLPRIARAGSKRSPTRSRVCRFRPSTTIATNMASLNSK